MRGKFPLHWPSSRTRIGPLYRESAKFDCTFAQSRDSLIEELERIKFADVVLSANVSFSKGERFIEPEDPGVAVYFKRGILSPTNPKIYCVTCDRWKKVAHNIKAIEKTLAAIRGVGRWLHRDLANAAWEGFIVESAKSPPEEPEQAEWILRLLRSYPRLTPGQAKDAWRNRFDQHFHSVLSFMEGFPGRTFQQARTLWLLGDHGGSRDSAPPRPPSSSQANWWDVLGVPQSSSPEVVQRAYRQKCLQHHPDRGGDSKTMARINEAFEHARRVLKF